MSMFPHEEWVDEAACAGMDIDIFFRPYKTDVQRARKVCKNCPVIQQCLDFAMACEKGRIYRYGVFGGLTPRQRIHLADKQRRERYRHDK